MARKTRGLFEPLSLPDFGDIDRLADRIAQMQDRLFSLEDQLDVERLSASVRARLEGEYATLKAAMDKVKSGHDGGGDSGGA